MENCIGVETVMVFRLVNLQLRRENQNWAADPLPQHYHPDDDPELNRIQTLSRRLPQKYIILFDCWLLIRRVELKIISSWFEAQIFCYLVSKSEYNSTQDRDLGGGGVGGGGGLLNSGFCRLNWMLTSLNTMTVSTPMQFSICDQKYPTNLKMACQNTKKQYTVPNCWSNVYIVAFGKYWMSIIYHMRIQWTLMFGFAFYVGDIDPLFHFVGMVAVQKFNVISDER